MTSQPTKVHADFVKVCPGCGQDNDEQALFCSCGVSLIAVGPTPAGQPAAAIVPAQLLQVSLINLDPVSFSPDGKSVDLPIQDGDYKLGRDMGTYQPDINLKDWAEHGGNPSFCQTDDGRYRAISRHQATINKTDQRITLSPVDGATKMFVWPLGDSGLSAQLAPGQQHLLQNGDVILIGDPFADHRRKAPGVIFRVIFEVS
ncbi:hypothetical protein A2368_00895 [Candidatus Collierbacteria bacterium RIFOXYB1_FULL_49_13]|uniref:FHA domain-containing protein n=1 Tax=Candidatus Collierbacteria bacterium RIFOXYB1_FULL_49_13 TaxID=1817728 RepID=A0A1F5FHR2_9BACT|nr:MAG: hypothetical protein A2368_00895 [Candidatus Collierbacteria bacterium RIFOXYB1_FULL_49_13]